jgi:hypothetical protein
MECRKVVDAGHEGPARTCRITDHGETLPRLDPWQALREAETAVAGDGGTSVRRVQGSEPKALEGCWGMIIAMKDE